MKSGRVELVVYAGHNQFYVVDEAPVGEADAESEIWDSAALEERLAVHAGSLAVLTATYGYVRVIVERLDGPPAADPHQSDHVVEAPLAVGSGRVSVLEETTPRGALPLEPGPYRARVSWSGVADAEDADPEPDDPVETILIELWPSAPGERTVLKWYPGWKPAEERPVNPFGLRVLVGRECDEPRETRIVGEPKDAVEFDDRALVRDADGVHWLRFYSDRAPYSEVMLELPESELERFELLPEPPRVALDETEVARTIALGAQERYRYFLDAVRGSGWLWELEDQTSPVEWQDEDGTYLLVWPHPRFAELYAEREAPGSHPVESELGAWLETAERSYSSIVVFPTSLFDTGRIVATPELAAQLRR